MPTIVKNTNLIDMHERTLENHFIVDGAVKYALMISLHFHINDWQSTQMYLTYLTSALIYFIFILFNDCGNITSILEIQGEHY